MPGVIVKIQPAILDWAMQKAQMNLVSGSVIETLEKWISGEKTPTFNQIENISKKINIPFGYFFLQEPPIEECKIVEFRTIDSLSLQNPSRELIDTVDIMSNVQEWMSEYNKDNGAGAYSFVGSANITDNVVGLADHIRKEIGLDIRWFDNYKNAADAFRNIRNAITDLGVLVMMNGVVGNNTHRVLNVDEFRAFTLVDPYAPLIFINSRDTDNGRLFSLFHELVHIWIGKDNFYNDIYGTAHGVSKEEQFCNAVAAEILVPNSVFTGEWNRLTGTVETIIDDLSKCFVCSRFVLLRKALDTGKIKSNEYSRLLKLFQSHFKASKNQEKASGGGDFYRTLSTKWDKRFVLALSASTQSGRTQYKDAYRLTNTTGKTFHELVGKAGGF